MRSSEEAAALGGPRIKQGEPWSQLGGASEPAGRPQSQLGGPQSQLGGPQSQVKGPRGGGTEKNNNKNKNNKKNNGAFLVCGGTIGHRPLRGRCPKGVYIVKYVLLLISNSFLGLGPFNLSSGAMFMASSIE